MSALRVVRVPDLGAATSKHTTRTYCPFRRGLQY
jgi:hypothetical protein